jgi:hypothetical protein
LQDESNQPPISVDDIDTAPETSVVSETDTHVTVEQLRYALVEVSEKKFAVEQELDATKKRVKTTEILDELIKPFAEKSFWFMVAYCAIVGLMVLAHGIEASGFKLPETVLQFLVGSTATTVIGLVGMVLTGIFVGARRGNGS